jgi:hypothetical protein
LGWHELDRDEQELLMALSSSIVWEIRTTGVTNTGGGFKSGASGTDYSQQDAAQYNGTNLASANGTTNPSVITSATHTFDANDVGNVIRISAGTNWTAGWYEIVSVSGGAATLDRSCGTSATLSNGTFSVGGAVSVSDSQLQTWLQTGIVGGNTIYIKSGSYTMPNITVTTASGSSILIKWIGYQTTRGDNPTDPANRPKLTFSTNNWTWGTYNHFHFLTLHGSAVNSGIFGSQSLINFCKITNDSSSLSAVQLGSYSTLANCEVVAKGGVAVHTVSNPAQIINNFIRGGTTSINAGNCVSIINNIIEVGFTYGVYLGNSNIAVVGNTIYGGTTKQSNGIYIPAGGYGWGSLIKNNIISGCTTGLVCSDASASRGIWENYNCFYDNTTNVSAVHTMGANSITTNPSFANVTEISGSTATTSGSVLTQSGGDFSSVTDNVDYIHIISGTGITAGYYLITSHTSTTVTLSTAPGTNATANKVWRIQTGHNYSVGTNMANAGNPGAFPGGFSSGYTDIGAVQRAPTSVTPVFNKIGEAGVVGGHPVVRSN